MEIAWKVFMTLEVENHSDPTTGSSFWVFYRQELVPQAKKNSSKLLILYSVSLLKAY